MNTKYFMSFKSHVDGGETTRYSRLVTPVFSENQVRDVDNLTSYLINEFQIGLIYPSEAAARARQPELKNQPFILNVKPIQAKVSLEFFAIVPITAVYTRYIISFLAYPEDYYIHSKKPYEKNYQMTTWVDWKNVESANRFTSDIAREYNNRNPRSRIDEKSSVFITNMIQF